MFSEPVPVRVRAKDFSGLVVSKTYRHCETVKTDVSVNTHEFGCKIAYKRTDIVGILRSGYCGVGGEYAAGTLT
jgi:hypothetical protein